MQQKIVLDEHGVIMSSDDTFFDSKRFADESILSHFPLVDSIFVQLLNIENKTSSITLPSVTSNKEYLPGYYDFIFSVMTDNDSRCLVWIIKDQTEKYQQMQSDMQKHNDEVIANERNLNAI